MLSRRIFFGALVAASAMAIDAGHSFAQYYGNGCSSCGTAMPVSMSAATCTPIQPVYSTCYQTVPVTTMVPEKQTVERPYYETAYEDREVTIMRPVTRQREIEVPTVSYQTVTENRTVNRDMGRWVTSYQPVNKCSPCQYDSRPGVIGWLNRSGYSFRSAMTPNYTTSRQYVPSMVTCNVPVTRQVAVPGTRRVTVNETEMVAERKTEKVAVQKLAYRKEEVTVMRPQTAYRTVPIGTSVAYGPGGYGSTTAYMPYYGGSAMAYGYPIIDNSATRSALAPRTDSIGGGRTADGTTPFAEDSPTRSSSNEFKRNDTTEKGAGVRGSSMERTFDGGNLSDPLPAFGPSTKSSGDRQVVPTRLEVADTIQTGKPAIDSKPLAESGWRATRTSADRRLSSTNMTDTKVSLVDLKKNP